MRYRAVPVDSERGLRTGAEHATKDSPIIKITVVSSGRASHLHPLCPLPPGTPFITRTGGMLPTQSFYPSLFPRVFIRRVMRVAGFI